MAVLTNNRGGVIKVTADAPVFFGSPTQITDSDARRIRELAHVKAYVKAGSLTIKLDSEIRAEKKAAAEKVETELESKKATKKTKES